MRSKIDGFVLLIVNPLDDVCLLAHSAVRKNSVSGSQIFQVALEGADVAGGAMGNVLSNTKTVRDFLYRIEPRELADPHAHSVPGMNKTVRTRHHTSERAVRICWRPISGPVDFARLNGTVADRGSG